MTETPKKICCPNKECPQHGISDGKYSVHSQNEQNHFRRLRCEKCGRTFSEGCGTILHNSRLAPEKIVAILKYLAEGKSHRGIGRTLGIDRDTVKRYETLVGNPRGCMLFQDEVSCLLGGMDVYRSGGGGKDLGFWLSVFNGVPVRVNRKTGKKLISAPTPAVAICGGIQPGMIRKILAKNEHFLDAGLMARFLAVNPPIAPVLWTEKEVSPETEQNYRRLIGKLFGMRDDARFLADKPNVVTLSAEAKELWGKFFNANAAEWHPAEAIETKITELKECEVIVSEFVMNPKGGRGKEVFRLA